MSGIAIRRRGYALGAEISGVDVSRPLDDETAAAIRQAVLDHIVVWLPGQHATPEQFRDFAGRFGELDTENTRALNGEPDRERTLLPEVIVRANQASTMNGKETPKSPPSNKWHSDFSHSLRPATISFLLATDLPEIGGDTLFTNLYMAYETLSPAFQKTAGGLDCVHDFTLKSTGTAAEISAAVKARPPVVHPLVRIHPDTHRKALFIAERVRNFAGMSEEESKPLIDFLMSHATRYEFQYRHRWTVNDLIMWDNRCSLHYAVQDYDRSRLRRLLRASLIGPTVGALATLS